METINIKVKEFKIQLNNKPYTFRLDFDALAKFQEKYPGEQEDEPSAEDKPSAMEIFNQFLKGEDVYNNIIKILSCACIEKEWKEKELKSLLSFDFQTMNLLDNIAFALAMGAIKKEQNEATEKNE